MSIHWRKAWKCDLCGHIWLAQGDEVPIQCSKCKARKGKWHDGKDHTGKAEPEVEPIAAASASGAQTLDQIKARFGLRPASQIDDPLPDPGLESAPADSPKRPFHVGNCKPVWPMPGYETCGVVRDRATGQLWAVVYGKATECEDEGAARRFVEVSVL